MGPAHALHGEGDVGKGHAVVAEAHVGPGVTAVHVRGHFQGDLVRDLAEVFGGQLAEVLVVDASGAGHDHPVAGVVGLDEVSQVIPGEKRVDSQSREEAKSVKLGNGSTNLLMDLIFLVGPRMVRAKGVPW